PGMPKTWSMFSRSSASTRARAPVMPLPVVACFGPIAITPPGYAENGCGTQPASGGPRDAEVYALCPRSSKARPCGCRRMRQYGRSDRSTHKNQTMTPADTDSIRSRALVALSNNRIPGFNFPGYFLDFECTRYDTGGVVLEMDTGAHNVNPDGTTHLTAVTCLVDLALAQAARTFVDPNVRTATMTLHLRFLGGEPRGRLRAEARSDGFSTRTALPEADCFGELYSEGRAIMRMAGTWAQPPTPDGRPMAPVPWARKE